MDSLELNNWVVYKILPRINAKKNNEKKSPYYLKFIAHTYRILAI